MRIKLSALVLMFALAVPANPADSRQPWVSLDASGQLVYRRLPRGDRIVDFSYAGYMGGGVPLPRAHVVRTLTPSGGDDTAAIQRAIDEVSIMPVKNGIRGAVVLAPGIFLCSETLNITASGVVLHGSGAMEGGTTLKLTGEPHAAIAIAGSSRFSFSELLRILRRLMLLRAHGRLRSMTPPRLLRETASGSHATPRRSGCA